MASLFYVILMVLISLNSFLPGLLQQSHPLDFLLDPKLPLFPLWNPFSTKQHARCGREPAQGPTAAGVMGLDLGEKVTGAPTPHLYLLSYSNCGQVSQILSRFPRSKDMGEE